MTASVVAVCLSAKKGMRRTPVPGIELQETHGIAGVQRTALPGGGEK